MSKPDYRKLNKAYRGIELACLINDTDTPEFKRAEKAMIALQNRTISKSEFDYYVSREEEKRYIDK